MKAPSDIKMSMHYDIDYRVNKSKIVNGLHCNGTTRVYCESGRMNVKENGMQELKPDAESDKSKKPYRHSTENLRDKSLFTSFDHLMSNFNLRKNKANSNTHLSYTNKVNNFNRNEKFTVDKKTNIKSLVHSSRKSSNPNNMMKSETMGRSGSRPKANSFIKRLSFRFKSNSSDSPQISQAQQNCFDYNASTFKGSNSMSIESNQKSSQEQAPLNLETLNKVFHIFDRDHDGSITIDDVQAVMDSFQFLQNELEMPSLEQIRVAFEKFDDNKNGAIEFDEFMNILKSAGSSQAMSPSGTSQDFSFSKNGSKLSQQNSHESNVDYDINKFRNDYSDLVMSNMKLIFEQFDKDNDGKITKHELTFVMRNLFPDEEITEQDISHMLKAADLDNNGFIDFEEFANMFNLYKKNPPSETLTSSEFCSPSPKLRSSVKIRKDISRSNKSINSKLNSRNSSKEPGKRSRSQSQSNSASQSPNIANYRKFVQLFTTSQLMDLKAAFTMFDKNGDHKISESELFQVMKYLGLKTTEKEVKAMIQVVDKNQNGYVDYDEFIQMMTQTNIKPQNAEDEVKKTFDIFDIDGNGYISADEIKKTMQNIGENLTDDEVKDMIKAADKNGDGKIDITEFSGLLSGTNIFQS